MNSIAIPSPFRVTPAKPIRNTFAMRFSAVLFEGPKILLAISASARKKATDAYHKATNYIESSFKNFLKDPDKKRESKVVMVESAKRAAELLLDEGGISPTETLVRGIMGEIEGYVGLRSASGKLIILNMECIQRQYSGEESQQNALILTAIHETVEKYGGFPATYSQNRIKWLDEGITEMIAREISFKLFPETAGTAIKEYAEYNSLAKSVCGVIGKSTVLSAFFQNSPGQIFEKLGNCGVPKKDILSLLKLGEALGNSLDVADFDAKSNSRATKTFNVMLSLLSKMKSRMLGFDWECEPLETAADRKAALDSIVARMNLHLKNTNSTEAGVKDEARKALLRLAADYVLVKYLGKEGYRYSNLERSAVYVRHGNGSFQEQSIDLFAQAIWAIASVAKERMEYSADSKKTLISEQRLARLLEDHLADGMAREIADGLVNKKEQQTHQPPFILTLDRISEKVGRRNLILGFFGGDLVPIIHKLGLQGKAAGFGTEIGDEQSFCAFSLLDDRLKADLKQEKNRLSLDGTWLKTMKAGHCPEGSGLDFIFNASKQYFPAMSIEERVQLSTSIFSYLSSGSKVSSENDVYKMLSFVNTANSRELRLLMQVSLLSKTLEQYEKASGQKIVGDDVGNLAWLASDMVYRWLMAAKEDPSVYAASPDLSQFVNGLENEMKDKGVYDDYVVLSEANWLKKDRLSAIKFYSYSLFSSDAATEWAAKIPDWDTAGIKLKEVFPQASKQEISDFFELAEIYLRKNNYESTAEPCRAVQLALSTKDALESALTAAAMDAAGVAIPQKKITIELPMFSVPIESRFRNATSNFNPSSLAQICELAGKYLDQTKDAPHVPMRLYSLKNNMPLGAVIESVGVAVAGTECTIGESSCFVPYLPHLQ